MLIHEDGDELIVTRYEDTKPSASLIVPGTWPRRLDFEGMLVLP